MINNHNIKCLLVILSCINNYILIILKSFSCYFPIKFCRQKYHYYLYCSYSFNYVINNSVIPRIFHGRIEITVKKYVRPRSLPLLNNLSVTSLPCDRELMFRLFPNRHRGQCAYLSCLNQQRVANYLNPYRSFVLFKCPS